MNEMKGNSHGLVGPVLKSGLRHRELVSRYSRPYLKDFCPLAGPQGCSDALRAEKTQGSSKSSSTLRKAMSGHPSCAELSV